MMYCEQRIGFTKQQAPRFCRTRATVRLTNKAGKTRNLCDACLKDYRDSWSMSMGEEQARAFFDGAFTLTPLAPVTP